MFVSERMMTSTWLTSTAAVVMTVLHEAYIYALMMRAIVEHKSLNVRCKQLLGGKRRVQY